MSTTQPACRTCGHREHWLGDHIATAHGLTLEAYLDAYPGAPLVAEATLEALRKKLPVAGSRIHPPPAEQLTISFAGISFSVNPDVSEDACLPLPEAYRIPEYGSLAEDVKEAAIILACRRSAYIWGPQGTGKDAIIHAFVAMTRTPSLMFQVEPGADIRAWFYSHEFNKEGTFWQEGELLKALRHGYTTCSGRVIPYVILITDFDRATKEQAESLRLVLDSIKGRVKGPSGTTYSVVPGTVIVVTANTAGGGDATGRYVSSNVIDSSILDRFNRALRFHAMDWKDEEVIVRTKFPLLVDRCPEVFAAVGRATGSLRTASETEQFYGEFSHRAVCAWLEAASDIIAVTGDVPKDLLRRSFRIVADKMPDKETTLAAYRYIDAFLVDGGLPGEAFRRNKKTQ